MIDVSIHQIARDLQKLNEKGHFAIDTEMRFISKLGKIYTDMETGEIKRPDYLKYDTEKKYNYITLADGEIFHLSFEDINKPRVGAKLVYVPNPAAKPATTIKTI